MTLRYSSKTSKDCFRNLRLFRPYGMICAMKHTLSRLLAIALTALIAIPLFAASDAATFILEQARTGKRFGPFEARQGITAEIGPANYRIDIEGNSRIVFVKTDDGRKFGPLDFVAGRMVELSDAFYTLRDPLSVQPPAPPKKFASNAEVVGRTNEGDYAPPPVPPSVVSEIDAMNEDARVIPPHPGFPQPDPGLCIYMWLDPMHVVPYKWDIGGRKGKSASMDYFSIGANSVWNGWLFDFSVIGGADTGSIVESGLAVDSASLDGGSGISFGGGYSRPFMKDGPWEITGAARFFYTSIGMDLNGRAMTAVSPVTSTNMFGEVATTERREYASVKTSADFTEWGFWLDFGASYTFEEWLFKGGVSIAPYTCAEVDAKLHGADGNYKIEAEREFPLSGWLGVEWGLDNWRYTATLNFGSDNMLRLGALYVF